MEEEIVKDMKPKLMGETWRKYPTETSKYKSTYGLYECPYCRKEFETKIQNVKCGDTRSCGCVNLRITHGLTKHPLYGTWANMVKRCTNPNHKAYKDYGARGITVCEEWLDVANFVAWCDVTHPNIEDISLDRIDNDKGYSPENCRWVDSTTQNINQRMKSNNTSGYVGIHWHIRNKKWGAYIRINKILKQIGSFSTLEEAVQARNNYIIENELPHKLNS